MAMAMAIMLFQQCTGNPPRLRGTPVDLAYGMMAADRLGKHAYAQSGAI